jgi:tetratricopeptide (TPR) repeat protein
MSSRPTDLLPDALHETHAAMRDPADSHVDCRDAAAVIDALHREGWLADRLDEPDKAWLLEWMRRCDDPRRFEVGDGLCVARIAAGQLDAAIETAEALLRDAADPALMHTLALARVARGETTAAIERLQALLDTPAFADLPAAEATQACLDLAELLRREGRLFKPITPLRLALEKASASGDEPLLEQAADTLIEQLIEQGGRDEALEMIEPYLDDDHPGLWERLLEHLGPHLPEARLQQGLARLITAGRFRPALRTLIAVAEREPDSRRRQEQLRIAYSAALRVRAPTDVVAPLAARLLATEASRREPDAPAIAAAAVAVAETEEKSPTQAKWHRDGVVLLISVAKHQGVLEEEIRDWVEHERLYHEHGIIERAARETIRQIDPLPEWLKRLQRADAPSP